LSEDRGSVSGHHSRGHALHGAEDAGRDTTKPECTVIGR